MKNYYNENAKAFFEGTVNVDMSDHYKAFLACLPEGGSILDAGCGSGRDSLAFIKLGYTVTAIDGAEEMCRLASELLGVEAQNMQFQEVNYVQQFDGIWASASLLHVPSSEIEEVLGKLRISLKNRGVLYASFKYGDFEGERNGRYFHDFKEDSARALFTKTGFKIEKMWITGDVRAGREDEKWVNLVARKL